MKKIRIEARIRNNRLWQAIFTLYPSVSAFCREHGFNEVTIGSLLNLKMSPVKKNGEYRFLCVRLADLCGSSPSYLFPLELYKLEKVTAVRELSFAELPAARRVELLTAPDNPAVDVEQSEVQSQISMHLDSIDPRLAEILRLRYGLKDGNTHTLKKIAEMTGLCGERIRVLVEKGHRQLRDQMRRHDVALRANFLLRRRNFLMKEIAALIKCETGLTGIHDMRGSESWTHYAYAVKDSQLLGLFDLGTKLARRQLDGQHVFLVPRRQRKQQAGDRRTVNN